MSVLGVAVATPLPVISALMMGPGVAAHILAKQVLTQFNLGSETAYRLPLCAFSAVVSGVSAFALIEGALAVAAIALATFSVVLTYEYFHLEQESRKSVDFNPAIQAGLRAELEAGLEAGREQLAGKLQELLDGLAAKLTEAVAAKGGERESIDFTPVLQAVQESSKTALLEEIKTVLEEVRGLIQANRLAEGSEALAADEEIAVYNQNLEAILSSISQILSAGGICLNRQNETLNKQDEALKIAHEAAQRINDARQDSVQASVGVSVLEKSMDDLTQLTNIVRLALSELKGSVEAHFQQMSIRLESRPSSVLDFGRRDSIGTSFSREYRPGSASLVDERRQSFASSASGDWPEQWHQQVHQQGPPAETPDNSYFTPARFSGSAARRVPQRGAPMTQPRNKTPPPFPMDPAATPVPATPYQAQQAWEAATPMGPGQVRQAQANSGDIEALKVAIMDAGQKALEKADPNSRSLKAVFKEVNGKKGPRGFIPDPCHLSTKLSDQERLQALACAIVELVEESPEAVNMSVWFIPSDLNYSVGSGGLGRAVNTASFRPQDKMRWLMFAGMNGLADLASYLVAKGADTTFQKDERTFLHFAARAGSWAIVREHYNNPFGGGGVPLFFDAACASSPEVLNQLVSNQWYRADLVNLPQALMGPAAVEFAQIIRPGTKVNALHLAALRQNEEMLEALLTCKDLKGDTPADLGAYGKDGPTPLLLLLDWIAKKELNPDHIAVKAVIQLAQGLPNAKLIGMKGRWMSSRERRAPPIQMEWAQLLGNVPPESAQAINSAMLGR